MLEERLGSAGLAVKGNAFAPRTGAFEVTIDGKPVTSKLTTGRFPDPNEVADQVAKQLGVEALPAVQVRPASLTAEERGQLIGACAVMVAIVAAVILGAQYLLA